MGSSPWPGCQEPTQRLSKPCTNNSSSNLLSVLASKYPEGSSSCSPTESPILSESHVVTSQNGDQRSRRKSRSRMRSFLQTSTNEPALAHSSEEEDSPQGGVVNDVRRRISRRSSSLSRLAHRKRSLTQLANASNSRLMLDDEESARMEQDIKEKEYAGRVAAQNHISPSVDGDVQPVTMASPIRRRSLYTPGLATRTPHDMLRRPPPPDRRDSELDRAYHYNSDRPQPSPLSDLAELAASRNAALALYPDGRSTPVNLMQLGGLSLGTLRITNGTASPEPREDMDMQASKDVSDSASHDEYVTASEGCRSEDEASSVNSRTVRETQRPQRRSNSPLKFEAQWESQSRPEISDLTSEPQANTGVKQIIDTEDSLSKRSSYNGSFATPRATDRASNMAQGYMLELPPSPYKSAPPGQHGCRRLMGSATPEFDRAISQRELSTDFRSGKGNQDVGTDTPEPQPRTTDHWRMFVDEAESRHAISNTTEDAYRILNGDVSPRNSVTDGSTQYLDSTSGDRDSSSTTNTTISGSEHTNARMAVTGDVSFDQLDSGYNSNASLNTAGCGTGTRLPAPRSLTTQPKGHRTISGPRDMPQHSLRGPEANHDTLSPQMRPPLTVFTRPATTVTVTTVSSPVTQRQRTAPPVHSSAAQITPPAVRSPQPVSATPTAETSNRYPTSAPSGDDQVPQQQPQDIQPSPTRSRKLQKSRRSSKPQPVDRITVQQLRELTETTIPQIPTAVASKHAERLRVFPSLEHTYPSSHHTTSDDSHSPSPDRASVPIRFPSPTNSMEDRSSAIVNGDLDWPTRSSKKKAKALAKDQSPRRRRKSQSEPVPSIVDFGDIASFIGQSPYDAAKSGSDTKLRTSSNWNDFHVDQNVRMSRPKSMINVNEGVTAEFTEQRRKSGQSIFRPSTPGPHDLRGSEPLPGPRRRPQSMFADTPLGRSLDEFERRDDSQASEVGTSRPHSMSIDVPPVPQLPSASRAKKLESKARKLRHSEGPKVPNLPSPSEDVHNASCNDRPVKMTRPQSLYDIARSISAAPSGAQLQRAQTYIGREGPSPASTTKTTCELEAFPPQDSSPSPLERSNTVIHHSPYASGSRRPQMAYADVPAVPTSASPQRRPQHYIHGPTSQTSSEDYVKAVNPQSYDPSQNRTFLPEPPAKNTQPAPNKLQKKRPENAKADIWKSDSLREELNKRVPGPAQDVVPAVNSDESDMRSDTSSIWDFSKISLAKQQEAASAALSANGFTVGQVCRAVAAPSIHDALRLHKANRSRTSSGAQVATMPARHSDSSYESVKSQAASVVQPLAFSHNSSTGFTPPPPTRSAPRSPPKSSHNTPGETQRLGTSYFSNNPEPQKSQNNSQNTTPASGSSPSPPGPRSKRKSSSKQHSPTISSPTATAADSYNSHAGSAPSPPAFSVARKRVGSMPSHMAQLSARSLKPIPISPPVVSAASSATSLTRPSMLTSRETLPTNPSISRDTFSTNPSTSRGTPISTNPSTPPTSTNPSSYSLSPPTPHPLSMHPTHPTPPFTNPPTSSHTPFDPSSAHPITLSPVAPLAPFTPLAPLYPPSRFENLSGRYQGGLQYGYEPGIGLGGSAGTRGAKNGAARKSVDVSMGWGLDLSDVPIFVAPARR